MKPGGGKVTLLTDMGRIFFAAILAAPLAAASLPLEFEPAGRSGVLYFARASNHFVALTRSGMTLGLDNAGPIRMTLPGANPRARIAAEERAGGVSNYFVGSDPARWRRGVPHYGRVRYARVWPGIDLLFHGREQALEYDFVVSPGASPRAIRLRFDDAVLRVDASGNLILRTPQGELTQHSPEIYQVKAGVRHELGGGYRLVTPHEVGFDIPEYDPQLTLTIDPVLTYSTYLGGTGIARLNAMTLDSAGNIYLTGRASSPDFPLSGSVTPPAGLGLYRSQDRGVNWSTVNAGVGASKVLALTPDPKNNSVIYAGTSRGVYKTSDGGLTWKAGAGIPPDAVTAVAIDPANTATVYAAMSEGLYQSTDAGANWRSILATPVLSVAASGTRLGLVFAGRPSAPILRSVDAGATWQEVGPALTVNALAIDPTNESNVYAGTARTGFYLSSDLGNTWTASNTGMAAGANPLTVYAIAIDPRLPQRVYAGTSSGLFRSPVGGAVWGPAGSGVGARPVLSLAINPQDANFVFAGTAGAGVFRSTDGGDNWSATGPAGLDANALAVDSAGSFVHAGFFAGTQAFVTKINPAGTALVYSNYFGGAGVSEGRAITVDSDGHTFVCGATDAPDFPVRNPYQSTLAGSRDIFYLRLNAAGSSMDYASYFGGHGDDVCEGIALDPNGNVYVAGNTFARASGPSANDFPTTGSAYQRSSPGDQDCFLSKFDDTGGRLTWSTYFGGSAADTCTGLVVDRFANSYLTGTTLSPNIPLVQGALTGNIPLPPVMRFASGFLTRFNPDGADVNYAALLGGLQGDSQMNGIALDPLGRVLLTGFTKAPDFPFTAKALSTFVLRESKTVIAVVDPNFNQLVYSTVLPGAGPDSGWRIQSDVFGNPWIIGSAGFAQFPVTSDALAHPASAAATPYAAQIDVTAGKLLHSTLLAGNAGGAPGAIAVARDGTVFAAGAALSTDFTVTTGPFQSAKTGDWAIFLQHLDFSSSTQPTNPTPAIAAVVNGASFAANALSPGEAITITGTSLGTSASTTSVSVNGRNIPLFFVSATQINGQLPFEIVPGPATLTVTVNGVTSAAASIAVANTSPGIFLVGTNRAAATNANNSVNASNNPAAPGEAITVYFTGIGPLDNAVATGQPAPLGGPLSRATLPVTVTIGGQPANALFVGLTPGSISLAQANVVVPDLPSGDYPVLISIGGVVSNNPVITVAR